MSTPSPKLPRSSSRGGAPDSYVRPNRELVNNKEQQAKELALAAEKERQNVQPKPAISPFPQRPLPPVQPRPVQPTPIPLSAGINVKKGGVITTRRISTAAKSNKKSNW